MEKYISIGKELGLGGDKLEEFVKEREEKDREREQRLMERDMKRLELEASLKEKEMELMLKDNEIELEKAKRGEIASSIVKKHVKMPKLPSFNDKDDRMDAYLKRFERFALNASWDKKYWATHLSALLQGNALEVYSKLSSEDALNYEALKNALLERYQLTEEGLRVKFRTSRPEIGETPQQFVVRNGEYLQNWLELADITKDFDSLKEFIIREQFLNVSDANLQIFLKEHRIKSLKDMTAAAQQYLEAHDMVERFQGQCIQEHNTPNISDNLMLSPKKINLYPKRRVCYNCGSSEHFIKDCPVEKTKGQQFKTGALISRQVRNKDKLSVVDGLVGDTPVQVLRDTGCSGVVVRKDLVDPKDLTGEYQQCVLVDGTVRHCQKAVIQVECPYFTGQTEAVCMDTPVYPLIIGNVCGFNTKGSVCVETPSKMCSCLFRLQYQGKEGVCIRSPTRKKRRHHESVGMAKVKKGWYVG